MIEGKDYVNVAYYARPHGKKSIIQSQNIMKEDMQFIYENDIKISMEDSDTFGFIVYLAVPNCDEELCEIANDRSCMEVVNMLVNECKDKNLLKI